MAMSIVDYIATEYHDVDDVERLKKMISSALALFLKLKMLSMETSYLHSLILRRGYKPYKRNFENT